MLQKGNNRAQVTKIQQRLIIEVYNCSPSGAYADFENGTYNIVCKFQRDNNLKVNGMDILLFKYSPY